MSTVIKERVNSPRTARPAFGGLLNVVIDLVISVGGYYVLRAVGVDVIWSLTIPGIVVGIFAAANTLRRRKLDMVGLLVLVELAATLSLSFITHDPRIAASRQPLYTLIGGVFCLVTLFGSVPFTAAATPSLATFGSPVRARAFEIAWRDSVRYRTQQRKLTIAIGTILIADAIVRTLVIYSFPASQISVSLLASNLAGTLGFVIIGVVARVLIKPARRIVLEIVDRLNAEATGPAPELVSASRSGADGAAREDRGS